MNQSDPSGNSLTTRCRFCGCEATTQSVPDPSERPHLQVIVACGSCGQQFTVLSAN